MLKKINLSIVCLLLVMLFAVQPCFAEEVNVSIEPDQIILNAGGSGNSAAAQTIQASIGGTGKVTECIADLTIDGADGASTIAIKNCGSHYCVIDDILHIYFDRDAVLAELEAEGIGSPEGDLCTATVEATISYTDENGEHSKDISGSDDVTVINPEKSPK